mmetsp:Transcript_32157/g.102414  ORF Transcript_32157/g.102414 Transcript_32157/m.102414 type:complete len:205 (-) Transcript_32157:697-1311(-)
MKKLRVGQDSVFEVAASEVSVIQHGACQVCHAQVCASQIHPCEVRSSRSDKVLTQFQLLPLHLLFLLLSLPYNPRQVCSLYVCVIERHTRHPCSSQVASCKICLVQAGSAEVGVAQVALHQQGSSQHGCPQVRLLQSHACEVRPLHLHPLQVCPRQIAFHVAVLPHDALHLDSSQATFPQVSPGKERFAQVGLLPPALRHVGKL